MRGHLLRAAVWRPPATPRDSSPARSHSAPVGHRVSCACCRHSPAPPAPAPRPPVPKVPAPVTSGSTRPAAQGVQDHPSDPLPSPGSCSGAPERHLLWHRWGDTVPQRIQSSHTTAPTSGPSLLTGVPLTWVAKRVLGGEGAPGEGRRLGGPQGLSTRAPGPGWRPPVLEARADRVQSPVNPQGWAQFPWGWDTSALQQL